MRKSLIVRMTIVIVFLGLGLVTNAQAQSDAGLVAEWHFDEGSGTILKDSSGNGNDGTIYGATWTTGISGKALSFDGKDDYINCGSINLDSSAFTYEVWFKTLESTDELLMVKEPATGDTRGYFISMGEGGPMGFGNGWGYIRTTKTYNDGKWHHVVGVFDDSLGTGFNKLKIYVDGITPSTTTVGSYSSPYIAPSSFYIGIYGTRTDTNDLFDGDIDEVRIYNRALSAGEIKAHYDTLIGSASVAPIAPTIAPSTSVTTPTSSPLSAPTPQPEKEEDGPSVSPVFLIGAAILAIVLIAGIGLSRRGKSGSGDATKPQPPVEPPTPPAEPPKPKAEVKPPEPPKAQRPIEPEPKVEATKPEPVRETAPLKPESAITITSAGV